MLPLIVSLLALAGPGAAAARPAADSAGYVTTLGRDTIALENVRRSARRIEGEFVLRVPCTAHFRYSLDLRGDGSVSRSVVELKPIVPSPEIVPRKVTIDFLRDSARVNVDSAGNRTNVMRAAPPGTMPALTTGFGSSLGIYAAIGLYDALLARIPQRLDDTVSVPVVGALSGRTGSRQVVRRSAQKVDVDFFRIAWTHLTLDAQGSIERIDASETTEKTQTTRTSLLDLTAAVADFAARDRSGKSIGIASPPDSVRATIGGATVTIQYSSPRVRGREILGATVPYDKVWRTGANAAVVLRTDRPLTIGGSSIPAGAYTLWTVPKRDGADLVINAQHGQWGTEYNSAQDVERIPMKLSKPADPRENFAILLPLKGSEGELRIAWADFVWSVPIASR